MLTRELFLEWRAPRFGDANPQRLTNPVWSHFAQHPELSAYEINQQFDGPSSFGGQPGWCAMRFGQSKTVLPDGRTIAVGGEHEDYYDPDFWIYNDVWVIAPAGDSVEIYGYPEAVFPPTDSHSATLCDDRIVVIGCIGHPGQRHVDETPVYALDLATLAMQRLPSTGAAPGWIWSHAAHQDGDRLVVTGGTRELMRDGARQHVETGNQWSYDLRTGVWTLERDAVWQTYELRRAGHEMNQLFAICCLSWHVGHADRETPFDREQREKHEAELGFVPDMALWRARYAPPIAHEVATREDDPAASVRLVVDGITVRYVESSWDVRITIEGPLPTATVEALVEDAREKLARLERRPYHARRVI